MTAISGSLYDIRIATVTFFVLALFEVFNVFPVVFRMSSWRGFLKILYSIMIIFLILHIFFGLSTAFLIVNGYYNAAAVTSLVVSCVCNTVYESIMIKLESERRKSPKTVFWFVLLAKDILSFVSAIIVLYYLLRDGKVEGLFGNLEKTLMLFAKHSNLVGNIIFILYVASGEIYTGYRHLRDVVIARAVAPDSAWDLEKIMGNLGKIALYLTAVILMILSEWLIPHSVGISCISFCSSLQLDPISKIVGVRLTPMGGSSLATPSMSRSPTNLPDRLEKPEKKSQKKETEEKSAKLEEKHKISGSAILSEKA